MFGLKAKFFCSCYIYLFIIYLDFLYLYIYLYDSHVESMVHTTVRVIIRSFPCNAASEICNALTKKMDDFKTH